MRRSRQFKYVRDVPGWAPIVFRVDYACGHQMSFTPPPDDPLVNNWWHFYGSAQRIVCPECGESYPQYFYRPCFYDPAHPAQAPALCYVLEDSPDYSAATT